ncbi:hypothetical protein N136_00175 [Leifsonia aquatica ATCC 14665]|uniref:Uncharacterized protein n=1 Tax=Leifsonia aquatica ATCC 14665 TaxID=1358026 RepID=U2RDZ5_LEIAQ|nr:hypothetical protein N136_00175 [Leifsonia aquatica ATCC 14665]
MRIPRIPGVEALRRHPRRRTFRPLGVFACTSCRLAEPAVSARGQAQGRRGGGRRPARPRRS